MIWLVSFIGALGVILIRLSFVWQAELSRHLATTGLGLLIVSLFLLAIVIADKQDKIQKQLEKQNQMLTDLLRLERQKN